jgi:hypothetical protein
MRVSEAISGINYALRGTDDDTPTVGSEEYNYWLSILNRKMRGLYNDAKRRWKVTWEVRSIGTLAAATAPEFDLDSDFLAPSDTVYAVTPSGRRIDFTIISPEEIDPRVQQVYISGQNPQVLRFTRPILVGDPFIGATLYMPANFMPANMKNANDNVPLPDADWGVMATAAFIAFNDIVYETKFSDLNAQANELWKQMTQANRRGTYGNPRRTPTVVKRITAPSRRG